MFLTEFLNITCLTEFNLLLHQQIFRYSCIFIFLFFFRVLDALLVSCECIKLDFGLVKRSEFLDLENINSGGSGE